MASIGCRNGGILHTHNSINEVRNCQWTQNGNTQAAQAFDSVARGSARYGRATEGQVRYIRDLVENRDLTNTRFEVEYDPTQRSSSDASRDIDELKTLPRKAKTATTELEDGMYLLGSEEDGDLEIFKVYHTVHGANQQVAKRLKVNWILEEDPAGRKHKVIESTEFVYEGKAPLKLLKPENRMTLEQAKHFSAVYGICIRCGATLTAEVSIERAMGPVCVTKI